MRHVLIISGDRGDSAGPFKASLEIIESGILQQHGITHVSIAGHPDGHPVVADDVMHRALLAKIEAAEQSGLTADIVTQFGFDAQAIARWIMKMRDLGIECPVRIGLAGPTNLTTLAEIRAALRREGLDRRRHQACRPGQEPVRRQRARCARARAGA